MKYSDDKSYPTSGDEGSDGEVLNRHTKESNSWAFWSKGTTRSKPTKEGKVAVTGTESASNPTYTNHPPAFPQNSDSELETDLDHSVSVKTRSSKIRTNLVLPTTEECYPMYSRKHALKIVLSYLKGFMWAQPERGPKHGENMLYPHLLRVKPRPIKKAVVIGIHGFFPTKVIQSLLGPPTGTSIKFADEGAAAVQRWADTNNFDVSVEKIALEGEGMILDRVENLYSLLENWADVIRDADVILFASHSQGTPVAVHIVSKLFEDGHAATSQKIGLLGMAGVSLGPFAGLDQKYIMRAYSSIESKSLRELFEFQDLDSKQSKLYTESLKKLVTNNVKITFIGSLNDQLVPLYSATCMHASHPNIYRGVYVDGRDVAPEFIADTVGLALKMCNMGSTDHGLIRELSGSLAGTFRGGGHSKIYFEPRVYDLAVSNTLETTNPVRGIRLIVNKDFRVPKNDNNPFNLPWCMRSMLYEANSHPRLMSSLNEIQRQYDLWKPDNKILKDLKYRLSPIQRSKL
ncbi:hypothetical protein NADFUDRAFT_81968 [Nadsonia fulvescens var. elongata DSM 6958]|uniref:YMC020W-like alpha/beta hydrolase domain-containing protein n=1 Tax=Nadsonia fulvescens var. elongata DSM 6958 TaxID=857566 RepID=A0A1E3PPZ0_9ASCO|nr:hypothetical protein NADFUDRAFT_81968 [Nadsonia fulvescens var. elongata DSM 6958]